MPSEPELVFIAAFKLIPVKSFSALLIEDWLLQIASFHISSAYLNFPSSMFSQFPGMTYFLRIRRY